MKLWVIVCAFLVGLSVRAVMGCTTQQQAAVETAAEKAEPVVFGACGLAESGVAVLSPDPAITGAVDLVCNGAEAVDKATADLAPRGVAVQVVAKTTVSPGTDTDGGARTLYHIRCRFHAARDAGGD